jgi:hypothetical protein
LPLLVTVPDRDRPFTVPVPPTLVTVPGLLVTVAQLVTVPFVVRYLPLLLVWAGRVLALNWVADKAKNMSLVPAIKFTREPELLEE